MDLAQDLASAKKRANDYSALRRSPEAQRKRLWADRWLVVELAAHTVITYALIFLLHGVWLKIAILLPWSLYSALCADNICHYLNHWPAFKNRFANFAVRALHIPLLFNPLQIWLVHIDHHFNESVQDNPDGWRDEILRFKGRPGTRILKYAASQIWESLIGIFPWSPLPEQVLKARPKQRREIVIFRWVIFLLVIALTVADPFNTLVFFIPAVLIIPSLASLTMNLTDHIPGTWTHPFRQATYLEPRGWWEETLCRLNRQTSATHLSHHLFPNVHWTQLRTLQAELAPLYEKHGAPRSFLRNSAIIGNWIALFRVLRRLEDECRLTESVAT